jgi:hypothetical protein
MILARMSGYLVVGAASSRDGIYLKNTLFAAGSRSHEKAAKLK